MGADRTRSTALSGDPAQPSSPATRRGPIRRIEAFPLMYLRMESRDWPCHFGGLAVLDGDGLVDATGAMRMSEVAERLGRRVARLPALRRRVHSPGWLGGRPLWVDDAGFDIANHLRVDAVPAPGGERELLEAATRAYGQLLDRGHPLWELRFLTGLEGGRVGALLKLHHSVADGMAAVTVMASLFDPEPGEPDPAPAPWVPDPVPGRWTLIADHFSTMGASVVGAARRLAHPRQLLAGARSVAMVLRRSAGRGGPPRTSLNRPVRAGRRVGVLRLDRAAARAVARGHGGTTNDVILALWAGGLRELLRSRGEPVSGVALTVGQAVSLRRRGSADEIDNQTGTMVLPLAIGDGDPRQRLAGIVAMTRRRRALRRRPAVIIGAMAGLAATPIGHYLFTHQRATTVLVTNVVGPRTTVSLLGSQVHEVLPIIQLLGNIGLTLCAFTYAGRVSLVVTADATAFPDLDRLLDGMASDWARLSAAHAEPDAIAGQPAAVPG